MTRKVKARDRYQAAYDAANELFDKIAVEDPPAPEIVAMRGRRMPCPHCGELAYFGAGALPGIVRSEDFSVTGVSACCGRTVRVVCGKTMSVSVTTVT